MIDKCKSVDLTVGDPKALRSITGRPLRHPICCQSPPKLREHASHAHSDSSEVTGDGSKDKSKPTRQFRKRAKYLVTKNKSRPAVNGEDPMQSIIKYSTGLDIYSTSNLGMRLRHAKVHSHGFLPTPPDLDRPRTPSDDSDFRANVSELEMSPRNPEGQVSAHGGSLPDDDEPSGYERDPKILRQPETRPISHEQLVTEVNGIYAGLVMVESKCIDIDEKQSAAAQEKDPAKKTALKNDQWQSLIALHKQLLHEHHDFLLGSQHPSASPALSRLAIKYLMPARMWRHGIHAFLEVLRHRLPESLEHMLAFIYIAYEMLALLYETVPTFEATWIERLGDLGRYRMAIEYEEVRVEKEWRNIARFWYDRAADKTPTTGRIYHHLAILARPCSIEQLSLYTRALTCLTSVESARESIMTLFNPILHSQDPASRRSSSFESVFIRAHGILFTSRPSDPLDRFNKAVEELGNGGLYGKYISKSPSRIKKTGMHVAVSNIAALLEYGTPKQSSPHSSLRFEYEDAHRVTERLSQPVHHVVDAPRDQPPSAEPSQPQADTSTRSKSETSPVFIIRASKLASVTLGISLTHADDRNMYPLVHVYLVFIWSLILVQQARKKFEDDPVWRIVEKDMPWAALCSFLNTLAAEPQAMTAKVWAEDFPKPDKEVGWPLPEDFVMRGQLYSTWYFPHTWFMNAGIDANERSLELPSMIQPRVERILWLGLRIASAARWIRYDVGAQCFVPTDRMNINLTADAKVQPQGTDQDTVMLDGATSESDVYIAQYTPPESSTTSDIEAPCFTPGTTSNAPSEPHDDSPAPSNGGWERIGQL